MTNDTSTLNGALSELGELMADNLVSMGVVDASASDGLTTLAGKILDIEPSIGGLDLDTAVTISSSESSISLGNSIVLTSKLTASYDDETIVDVDLSGVLQNATLIFKNGNTTIGTAVTDVNGVATFTYTPPVIGTLSLKTIFAGTDNFNNCESSFINVTVVAPSYDDIVLTADDSILSYYDGDSTTLRAQLMDGTSTASVSGVTVEFFNGSTSLGTAQTDSNGVATKTYTSTGAGDVTLSAEADNGTLSSETYAIEDCIYYSTSETECTSSTNYITIADLSSMTLPSDFELSMDYKTNCEARCGLFNKSTFTGNPNYSVFIGSPSTTGSTWYYGYRTSSTTTSDVSASATDYHTYTITRNGNTFYYKRDNGTTYNKSVTWFNSYNYVIGIMMWGSGKYSYVKNIKIKPL